MPPHSWPPFSKFNFYVSQMVVAQRNGNLSQFTLPLWWKRATNERDRMGERNNINIKHLTHNTFPLFLSDLLIIFPWIKFSLLLVYWTQWEITERYEKILTLKTLSLWVGSKSLESLLMGSEELKKVYGGMFWWWRWNFRGCLMLIFTKHFYVSYLSVGFKRKISRKRY